MSRDVPGAGSSLPEQLRAAAIGPGAIRLGLLVAAAQEIERLNISISEALSERDAAIAKDHEAIAADRLIERALGRAEGAP